MSIGEMEELLLSSSPQLPSASPQLLHSPIVDPKLEEAGMQLRPEGPHPVADGGWAIEGEEGHHLEDLFKNILTL